MELTVNTFSKGLQMDSNPMVQGKESLTDCLNGTFITLNGNELTLLNDMGNARVDRAYLPSGYEPVGIKEYGGIIYVASYNPVTGKSQIGSFPSPERIKGTELDNLGTNLDINNIYCENYEKNENLFNIKCLKTDSILRPLTDDTSLHIGDKFSIYYTQKDNDTFFNNVSNYENTYDGKIKSPKNKLYTLSVGILNSLNEFVDITSNLNRINSEGKVVHPSGNKLYDFNNGYFIARYKEKPEFATEKTTIDETTYLKNRLANPDLNTYAYKLIGPLYIKQQVNHVLEFTYNIKGYTSDKSVFLTIIGTLKYNCPDGITEIANTEENDLYKSYELYEKADSYKGPMLYDVIIESGVKDPEKVVVKEHSYDSNTGLYTMILLAEYKFTESDDLLTFVLGVKAAITENLNICCEDSNTTCNEEPRYLSNLSEKVTIDTSLLGSGKVKLKEYKFFNSNDYSTFQYRLEYYEKEDEQITDMLFVFYNVEDNEDIIYSEFIEPRNGTGIVKVPFNNTQKLYRGELRYKINDVLDYVIYDEVPKTEKNNTEQTIFLLTTKLLNPCYNSSNKEEYVRNFKDFVLYSHDEDTNFKDAPEDSEKERRKKAISDKLTINYEYDIKYDGQLVKVGNVLKNGSLLVSGFLGYTSKSVGIPNIGEGNYQDENNTITIEDDCGDVKQRTPTDPLFDSTKSTIFQCGIKFTKEGTYKLTCNEVKGSGNFLIYLEDKEIINLSINTDSYVNQDAPNTFRVTNIGSNYALNIEGTGDVLIQSLTICIDTSPKPTEVDILTPTQISNFKNYSDLIGASTEEESIIPENIKETVLLADNKILYNVQYGKIYNINKDIKTYEYTFENIPTYSTLQLAIYSKKHDASSTENNLTIEIVIGNTTIKKEYIQIDTSTTALNNIPITYSIKLLPFIKEEIYDNINNTTFNCTVKLTSIWFIKGAALLYNGTTDYLEKTIEHTTLDTYNYLPYYGEEDASDKEGELSNITNYLTNKYTKLESDKIYIVKTNGKYQFIVNDGSFSGVDLDGRILFVRNCIFDIELFIKDCNNTGKNAPKFDVWLEFQIARIGSSEYPFDLLYTKQVSKEYNIISTYNYKAALSYVDYELTISATDLVGSVNFYIGLFDSFKITVDQMSDKTFTAYIRLKYVDNGNTLTITSFNATDLEFETVYSFYDFVLKSYEASDENDKLNFSVPACYMNDSNSMIFELDIRDIRNGDSVFYNDVLVEGTLFDVQIDVYRFKNPNIYNAPKRASSSSTTVTYGGTNPYSSIVTSELNTKAVNNIELTYSQKFKVLSLYDSKLSIVNDYILYPDYIKEYVSDGINTEFEYNLREYTPLFIKENPIYNISSDEICTTNLNYITFNLIFRSGALSGDKLILNGFIKIHDAIDSVRDYNKEIANIASLGITVDSSSGDDAHYIGPVFEREKLDNQNVMAKMKYYYEVRRADKLVTFDFSNFEPLFNSALGFANSDLNKSHKFLFSYNFFSAASYNGHYNYTYITNNTSETNMSLLNFARVWWRDANNSWVLLKNPFFRGSASAVNTQTDPGLHNQVTFCDYLKTIFYPNFSYCAVQNITCKLGYIWYPNNKFIYTGRFNPIVDVGVKITGGDLNISTLEEQQKNYPILFKIKEPTSKTEEQIASFKLDYNEDFFDEINNVLTSNSIPCVNLNTGHTSDYLGEQLYPGIIYTTNAEDLLVKNSYLTEKLLYSSDYKFGNYNGVLYNGTTYVSPTYRYDFCRDNSKKSNDDQNTLIDYNSAKTVSI